MPRSRHVRRSARALALAALSCVMGLQATAAPADGEWKAGLAAVKITPDKPLQLSGYASRITPFERVEHDLWAKALALEDREGRRAVLLTMDLSGLYGAVAEAVVERTLARTGLQREQLLLSWSHNHSGPSLSLKADPLPGVAPENRQNTVAYTRWLVDRLPEVAADSLKTLQPARLSWGHGVATFVMNRREFTPRGIILGVNPRGPVDRTVPVLRVDGADGRPRAVLFGCAAHNTTLGSKNLALAGDYAGFAQDHIQERLPGVQAMFLTGCAGDANPYPRDTMELARRHGEELGAEVCRVLETKLNPVTGPLKPAFGHAALPLQSPGREKLQALAKDSPSWQTGTARNLLEKLDRGEPLPAEYRVPVSVWQFGRSLTLVALPGEVVVDYVSFTTRDLGPLNLWVAAYCNEGVGYIPSKRILDEGGYETRGLSSGQGWFAPEAEAALMATVRELARQAGRQARE